ncbi:MAG: DNA-3-methyladenine glycosylase I [Clostridia bacterium]|nr:DNA-3-methyladenine glycosylase I [Clostridia bacterium]
MSALPKKSSRDLRKHGFSFAGNMIACAFLQAIGIINDHQTPVHTGEDAMRVKGIPCEPIRRDAFTGKAMPFFRDPDA